MVPNHITDSVIVYEPVMTMQHCSSLFVFLVAILSLFVGANPMEAQEQQPIREIKLPGHPFCAVVSTDQQWIFVSLSDGQGGSQGIAVLQNKAGKVELLRVIPMPRSPSGLVLTHDEDMLIAAADDYVVFFYTQRLETGGSDAAFQWVRRGAKAGCVYVNVTADDKTLFVSDEFVKTISVIDLGRIRGLGRDSAKNLKRIDDYTNGSSLAVIGRIPVGNSPVALTFSKDERWLFSTSEVAPAEWNWPRTLQREGSKKGEARKVSEGAVVVIDVAKARIDPQHSIVARVPAGGSPVRAALSPDGTRLFVTARNSDAVLMFNTAELIKNGDHAMPIKVPVGKSPVPVIGVDGGKFVLVGNSNRYGANAASSSTLTVLDTSRIGTNLDPVVGHIPCGAFPRNFCLASDGRTLFLTNYRSDSLQIIDTSRISELLQK